MVYVEPVLDRTTRPCLTFGWDLTSDRIAIFVKSAWAKAKERPVRLNRCSNMDIRLNIGMRCARRKMMRHTSAIVAVPSQATRDYHPSASHGVPTLSGHVLTLSIARLPLSHGPIVLRSTVNGSEASKRGARGYCCVFCCVYFTLTSHTCIVSLSRVLTTFVTTS